jgi:hypothetical protein
MQWLGVFSILLAVFCIFALYEGWEQAGKMFFGASLVSLMASLFLITVGDPDQCPRPGFGPQ